MRYLSFDTTGKTITAAEAQAITSAGLWYGLVWEGGANGVKGGAAQGAGDATAAISQANALGYRGPIYFAIDYDAPESDQPAINAYFKAVIGVLGLARTGVYGGYWPVKRLFDAGLVARGWQTLAWSGGNREARCSLYQNGQTVLGADVNDVLKDDWFNLKGGTEMVSDEAHVQACFQAFRGRSASPAEVKQFVGSPYAGFIEALNSGAERQATINQLNAGKGILAKQVILKSGTYVVQ